MSALRTLCLLVLWCVPTGLACGKANAKGTLSVPSALTDYSGTLGAKTRIGMTLALNGQRSFDGSYFYAKYLKDIPLRGELRDDGHVVLKEVSGGATLDFTFVGNGSEAGSDPGGLGFETSVGLAGTWTSANGKEQFPVKLNQVGAMPGKSLGHRYFDDESDAEVERRAKEFLRAVQVGDRSATATAMHFPVRVNTDGKNRVVRTRAAFLAQFPQIFTPEYTACVGTLIPHQMFANAQGVMLGNGAVWFDEKGVITFNPCTKQ